MDADALRAWFEYHPPTSEAVKEAHETVRAKCFGLAAALNTMLPDGREKAMALRAVDDACMYANAAIARSQLVS